MARSNEPIWWAPFFAGAGISALLMPITIFLTSLGVRPFGFLDEQRLWTVLHHPLTRICLFVLISLSLFHAVHRFRFILIDLGLKAARNAIAVICYGSAVVGTLVAAVLLLHIG